jgi:YidC/Oxa1 family membrane protein insertase
MDKKVLLAFALSFAVLVIWSYLFPSQPSVPPLSPSMDPSTDVENGSLGNLQPLLREKTAIGNQEPMASTNLPSETPQTQTVNLDLPSMTVEFTNQWGGGISSIVLKRFFETTAKDVPYRLFGNGLAKPLFRLATVSGGCVLKELTSGRTQDQAWVRISYECGNEGVVHATFAEELTYRLKMTLESSTPEKLAGKELFVFFPLWAASRSHDSYNQDTLVFEEATGIERIAVATHKILEFSPPATVINWIAFGDRYFFIGYLPQANFKPIVFVDPREQTQDQKNIWLRHQVSSTLSSPVISEITLLMGPKDQALLKGLGSISQVVDFGFFKILAVPIYQFLKFIHNHIFMNFGIAIIILTILIRLLFFPLTIKGMGNMQAMQTLQPQLKSLREKYKNNREKLNQEMVALFRAHKVNPLGGCLPMLVQIPVFIALYSVLNNSVDLYHAPFALWIHDLSSKDPFYVLPILLGISFFVQQKMTPSTVDPAMQKMMLFMPILFSLFMINLPSGLNLYILTSTLLGIVQQVFINKRLALKA